MIKKFKEYIGESKTKTSINREDMEDYLLWFEDHYETAIEYWHNCVDISIYVDFTKDLLKMSEDFKKISNELESLTNRVKSDYGKESKVEINEPMIDGECIEISVEISINKQNIEIESPNEFEKLIVDGKGKYLFSEIKKYKDIDFDIEDSGETSGFPNIFIISVYISGFKNFEYLGTGEPDTEFIKYVESIKYSNQNYILEYEDFVIDEGSNGNIFDKYSFRILSIDGEKHY